MRKARLKMNQKTHLEMANDILEAFAPLKQLETKAKHAPGPWLYEKETQARFDTMTGIKSESITHWIKFDSGEFSNICLMISSRSKEEIEANAHLIAAAPEMLEVLAQLNQDMDEFVSFDMHPYQTEIRNLIRKAKGEL